MSLNALAIADIGKVRAGAEIGESSEAVDRNGLGGEIPDELHLERLAEPLEELHRIGARELLAR